MKGGNNVGWFCVILGGANDPNCPGGVTQFRTGWCEIVQPRFGPGQAMVDQKMQYKKEHRQPSTHEKTTDLLMTPSN